MKKFYVTTPIYYVNAPPHLGTGYTTVIADTLARSKRMRGCQARLVTGSDEHSQNIADKAAAEGITPEAFCTRLIPTFHAAWTMLDIGPYDFYRTSSAEHRQVVQELFRRIHAKGDIYKAEYSGWYHTTDNRFLNEDEVPSEPESHPYLKYLTEDAYWFRLSRYEDWLLKFYDENPEAIIPAFRKNEMLNRIKEGLRDLCISRSSTDWGIPLPWDDKHVFYVWVDALVTYLTGSGYRLDAETQPDDNFWPCDLHIMAKDIPWFHTVIWPAMLASAGVPVARQVLVHGYWNFGGDKMSKTKGNVISPKEAVDLVGSDGVRYFMLREVRLGFDGNFSMKALAERYNYDLANDFGNLLHRSLTMLGRFLGGEVPTAAAPAHHELESLRHQTVEQVLAQYECLEFKEALEKSWELVRACNRFIDETKPWEVAKDPARKGELEALFSELFRCIRSLLVLLAPVMPRAADAYWGQLGLPGKVTEANFEILQEPFPSGIKVEKPSIVFQKLDLAKLFEEEPVSKPEEAAPAAAAAAPAAVEEYITYDDFNKVRLITAKVLKAEAVEGADKLIRLTLDDGKRSDRTVVSGIRKFFTPEEMQGKTICIVDNLKPRKIFGIMSEGMILAAGDGDVLRLVNPEGELAPGIRVG